MPLVFLCALAIPLLFLGFLLGMARLETALLGTRTLPESAPASEAALAQSIVDDRQDAALDERARQIA